MIKYLLARLRKNGLAGPPQDVDEHDQNPEALPPNLIDNQENPDDQHREQGAGLGANNEDQEQHEDPTPNAERDIFYTVWVSKKRRTRRRKRRSFDGFYLPFVSNDDTRITGSFEDERHQEEASSSERRDPTGEPSSTEEDKEKNDNIESNGNSEEENEIEEDESEQNEGGNHDDELEDADDQENEGNSSDEDGSDPSWRLSDQSSDDDDDDDED